jgi:hypothetical protein
MSLQGGRYDDEEVVRRRQMNYIDIYGRSCLSKNSHHLVLQTHWPKMPHKEENQITAVPLHDSFAAEVRGVDFSKNLSEEDFAQIHAAITKVGDHVEGKKSC